MTNVIEEKCIVLISILCLSSVKIYSKTFHLTVSLEVASSFRLLAKVAMVYESQFSWTSSTPSWFSCSYMARAQTKVVR